MYDFLQPSSLQEAVSHLGEKEKIRIVAGGTDLIVEMRSKKIDAQYIMDCKKIPEFSVLAKTDKGLEIGGAITCTQLLESGLLTGAYDVLRQGTARLANVLLRNRATVVGNLCNASPVADTAPACLVLGGYLVTVDTAGGREIPLKDFFLGPKRNALKPNELVVKLVIPPAKGEGVFHKKQRIQGHDLAQVSVAGFLDASGRLSLCFGAAGPIPLFIEDVGTYTKDQLAAAKQDIISKARATITPIGDVRSSKEYREAMVEYFTGLIVDQLSGR